MTRDERDALVDTIRQELLPRGAHVAVAESLEHLALPGASVVLCTLEPGLAGGTLDGLLHALHAIRVARELHEHWERPVVPVCLNRSDRPLDRRSGSAWVLNDHLDLVRVGLSSWAAGAYGDGAELDDERHALPAAREALRQLLWEGPHRDPTLELAAPRPGETLAGATTRFLTEVLGPHGLVVVESGWLEPEPARALARALGADPLAHLARASADHDLALDLATEELVFDRARNGAALRPGGEGLKYDDEPGSRTAEELAAEVVQEPSRFAPGRAFAPLVETTMLPVAAMIGSWSELPYIVASASPEDPPHRRTRRGSFRGSSPRSSRPRSGRRSSVSSSTSATPSAPSGAKGSSAPRPCRATRSPFRRH